MRVHYRATETTEWRAELDPETGEVKVDWDSGRYCGTLDSEIRTPGSPGVYEKEWEVVN